MGHGDGAAGGTALILLVVTLATSISFYVSTKRVVQNSYVLNCDQIFGRLNQQISDSINRACELLLNTEYSVGAVGQMVGIDDPHYFSRTFKERMGVSLNKYRRMWGE